MNSVTTETSLIEKIPPQNLEAEMAVLGSMLFEETAVPRVIELIKEHFFHVEANRKVFFDRIKRIKT